MWIAGAIAIWLTRVASADGIGVIAIGGDRVAIAKAATGAVDGKARVESDAIARARAAVASGAVPIETVQRFRRVREMIDEGWRAYLRVQFEFAQSRLASARTEAEALVALPGGDALYAEAALKLGAVLGQLGRAQEAQAAIALALALDPDRPITLAEFSPDIVSAVAAARAVVPEIKRVHVATEPPGALVSIDGKELGRSPLDADVARGQHVVVARAPRFTTRALGFAVDDSHREVAIDLERDDELATLESGPEPGMPDVATQLLVEAALRFADLDELLLVVDTERRGEPTLLLQRCVAWPTRCSAIVELGYGNREGLVQATRTAVQETHAVELRYTPSLFGDPRVTGKPPAEHCHACRSPWLWGGVSVAAAITTVIVIAVVSASKPPPIVSTDPGDFMKH
ncbi:MAG: hypothetical protein JWO36_713 [Myxococcales bacterium]|nr:hypothetical protein [Myxococcales bacterium]